MTTAETFAELSHARRLHVGAIVVKDDRIISIGYNGMPSGWDNDCEDKVWTQDGDYTLKTKPEVLHAETNAIAIFLVDVYAINPIKIILNIKNNTKFEIYGR